MSRVIDLLVEQIITSLDNGISVHGGSAGLTSHCRQNLRTQLRSLVATIKSEVLKEVRNETDQ
jgi:hypothetical protein